MLHFLRSHIRIYEARGQSLKRHVRFVCHYRYCQPGTCFVEPELLLYSVVASSTMATAGAGLAAELTAAQSAGLATGLTAAQGAGLTAAQRARVERQRLRARALRDARLVQRPDRPPT